ncbi:hypothetical protein E8E12_000404 [Didymella heteroderae]|uniref:Uncharacterized protein n=1 Tax=Didymella heteroderae TaxID=1769908 RepID=A0A9P4WLS4_9PLEO|nr:hypothetical protein E8E12_000404 [Didymella heteroderae]
MTSPLQIDMTEAEVEVSSHTYYEVYESTTLSGGVSKLELPKDQPNAEIRIRDRMELEHVAAASG